MLPVLFSQTGGETSQDHPGGGVKMGRECEALDQVGLALASEFSLVSQQCTCYFLEPGTRGVVL